MFYRFQVVLVCSFLATLSVSGQESQLRVGVPDRLVGDVIDYVVKHGDTLPTIAARFGADAATLARKNGWRTDRRLVPGETLLIDNRHVVPAALDSVELVVNIPQRMLFYREYDRGTVGYPVAVGRPDWPTPSGTFVVSVLERHPTWEVPQSILEESRKQGRIQAPVVPPGPGNPLGDFWIGLSLAGIGIHATNAPSTIFRTASHGCIRLHPDDIEQLFGHVEVGASGRIVYEPVLMTVAGDAVYLEVHRDVYRRAVAEPRILVRKLASDTGMTEMIDWTIADAVAAAHDGIARDVTRAPRTH